MTANEARRASDVARNALSDTEEDYLIQMRENFDRAQRYAFMRRVRHVHCDPSFWRTVSRGWADYFSAEFFRETLCGRLRADGYEVSLYADGSFLVSWEGPEDPAFEAPKAEGQSSLSSRYARETIE
jgi:hypothetical protein